MTASARARRRRIERESACPDCSSVVRVADPSHLGITRVSVLHDETCPQLRRVNGGAPFTVLRIVRGQGDGS